MLKLVPGINVEFTPSQVEAGYSVSNMGRFRSGLFEKIGGWKKFFGLAVQGIPRALHAWQDRNAVDYLGFGTTTQLGVIANNTLIDLTPQQFVSDFAPDFSTVVDTPNVIINDPNVSDVTIYDSIEFNTPISVGGIILSGTYPIDVVLGTTQYRITAKTDAAATVNNGGVVPVFTTQSGTAQVTVTLPDHGLQAGNTVSFILATSVGGVTIQGTYTVTEVSDDDNFIIAATNTASSSASATMNGGDAELIYTINLGPVAAATGYSVGPYSDGAYSTGTAPGQQTGTPITATNWTLDNWGDIFLACPTGGGVYSWQPNSGFSNAGLVSGAPAHSTGIFVAMQTQMLVCYGSTVNSNIGIEQNPLLVAWSNVGDYTNFQVSTTSQAGSRVLSTGSKIVFGMAGPQQELLWTDLGLWAMNYLGSLQAGVWGFTELGFNCGLIGRHAAVRQGGAIYWMGISNFYVLAGGAPQPIQCSVWDVVFQDLNTDYQDKCFAWSNTPFNEIWFFFPRKSTNATECDCFVKVNTLTGLWDYTPMNRTAGIDQSVVGMPISTTTGGLIYEHEVSRDADGQPINSYFITGWFPVSDGQDIVFCDWFLPDMKWGLYGGSQNANIQITFESVYYAGDTPTSYGPFTVTQGTQYINPRVRGRLGRFKIGSNDVGSFWRIGGCRFRVAPDGRLP